MNLLINANAKRIPIADNSVNCVVTSPPYYGLRDYGTAEWVGGDPDCDHKIPDVEHGNLIGKSEGKDKQNSHTIRFNREKCYKCGAIRVDNQIGLEQSPDEYVEAMCQVFDEVWRVLRDDGTVWLNLGDSYASVKSRYSSSPHTLAGHARGDEHDKKPDLYHYAKTHAIKDKDLIGIPWRVAFALQARGWYLRQDIIWHKPNPMPESVKDRCTKAHEYIFLLTKSARYWYDNEAIMEVATGYDGRKDTKFKGSLKYDDETLARVGGERWPNKIPKNLQEDGQQPHTMHLNRLEGEEYMSPARNKRSVWTVTTKPYPGSHYAVFPPDLIEPCILAGCPEGGMVLDPFAGSGTTLMVARKHRRNAIGLDLNFEYLTTNARERLQYGSFVPVADGITQLTLEA